MFRQYKLKMKSLGLWSLKRGDRSAQSFRWRNKPENKIKKSAHNKVYIAIKTGFLIKPDNCQNCGSNSYIQAHHDNYDKPLIVRWLCHKCHNKIHKESEDKNMADKVCPPVKSAGVPDGMNMPESHSTLTTPNPNFGNYFGADMPGSNAVDSSKIMGKK